MQPAAFKICPRCQSASPLDAKFCARCGHQFSTVFTQPQTPPQPPAPQIQQTVVHHHFHGGGHHMIKRRHGDPVPSNVLLFSIFLGPWLGMVLNQQYLKAVIVGLILPIIAAAVTFGIAAIPILIILWVDVYQIAERLYRGEEVHPWQFF